MESASIVITIPIINVMPAKRLSALSIEYMRLLRTVLLKNYYSARNATIIEKNQYIVPG
jgi:hypothetical protein